MEDIYQMHRRFLKICVICDIGSIHCRRWVEGLKSRGHDVFVLSEQKGSIDGVHVITLNPPPYLIKMFPSMKAVVDAIYRKIKATPMRKLLFHENPDIVYAHFLTDHGWRAITTAYRPTVVIAYGSDILIRPNRYKIDHMIVRKSLQYADGVIGVADHMKKKLLALGCSPERLRIIHNAVDTKLFNAKGRRARNYQKPLSNPIIINTRAMKPVYNLELLIKALPPIVKVCPGTKVIMVGEGKGKYRIELLAKNLGVYESIQFIPKVPYTKMPNLFKKADIFVSTSRSDGLCIALLESMACGVFPVVSNIPGNRELIDDGINGYLFDTNSPGTLAEAVIKTIRNPEIMWSAMNKNQQLIKKRYTEAQQMKKTENFFYHIVNKLRV